MNTFTRMFRESEEFHNGKIRFSSGGWVLNPSEKLIEKTMNKNPTFRKHGLLKELDADGKTMWLVSEKSGYCDNPEIVSNEYPKIKSNQQWCIPASICKKCTHYIKGGQTRLWYPHCVYKKEKRGGKIGAAKHLSECFGNVVRTANKIMGR